jgi:hypothetical protein
MLPPPCIASIYTHPIPPIRHRPSKETIIQKAITVHWTGHYGTPTRAAISHGIHPDTILKRIDGIYQSYRGADGLVHATGSCTDWSRIITNFKNSQLHQIFIDFYQIKIWESFGVVLSFYCNHRVAMLFGGVAHSLRPAGGQLHNPVLYLVLLLNKSLLRNSKYNLFNSLLLLYQSFLYFKL